MIQDKQEFDTNKKESKKKIKEQELQFDEFPSQQPNKNTYEPTKNEPEPQPMKKTQKKVEPIKQNKSEFQPTTESGLKESLYTIAFAERKTLNISQLRQYMDKRFVSYNTRSKIFQLLRQKMYDKQKLVKKFVNSVIKYFVDYVALLKSLHKSLSSKLQLKSKYKVHPMIAAVKQSIEELLQLNQDECQHLQKFIDWLEKVLIEGFKSAEAYYKERIKKLSKQLQKIDYNYYDLWEKQQKYYQKISEGDDLLEKQLQMMEKIKLTDQATINRGVGVYEAWESILEEEKTIKNLLKDNILQFHEKYIRFHKKRETVQNLRKYWSNLPQPAGIIVVFQSLFSEKEIQFICFDGKSIKKSVEIFPQKLSLNTSQKQNRTEQTKQESEMNYRKRIRILNDNFEIFLRLKQEEMRIGNPYPLLDILVLKKFKSKIQKSQREWKLVKLIFTLDHNLIMYDEQKGKCLLKLVENTIKLKRISENILELIGTQKGFIMDSTKKQAVHFETLDEVQEFVFFMQSIEPKK